MTEVFGAGVSIYGTVVTAVLAIILAVPVAFGVAFTLTELAPPWLRRPVGTAVELLAAVPVHHLRHVGLLPDRAAHGAIRPAAR